MKFYLRMAAAIFIVCLMLTGLTACMIDISDFGESLRLICLRGELTSMDIPLTYDAEEGLHLWVQLNFDSGDDAVIHVLPLEEGAVPHASVVYPADLEEYGFMAQCHDGTFSLSTEKRYRYRCDKFAVTIWADVSEYALYGAFTVTADHAEHWMQTLSLEINGAASCALSHINVQSMEVQLNGATDMELSGTAETLMGVMNGAGNLEAEQLVCRTGDITINGAGNADVNVTEALHAQINGAGSMTYRGDPQVTKIINGLGAVDRKQ